jgi:hypothetical protein
MAMSDELTAADLERLSRAEAPDLVKAMLAFPEQPGKVAKGEWQSCLASLVRLRAAHPGVELGGF